MRILLGLDGSRYSLAAVQAPVDGIPALLAKQVRLTARH